MTWPVRKPRVATGMIRPLLWLCRCGQFNNVAEDTCMACGAKR